MSRFEEIKNMNIDEMVRFIDHIASEDYCDRAVGALSKESKRK